MQSRSIQSCLRKRSDLNVLRRGNHSSGGYGFPRPTIANPKWLIIELPEPKSGTSENSPAAHFRSEKARTITEMATSQDPATRNAICSHFRPAPNDT